MNKQLIGFPIKLSLEEEQDGQYLSFNVCGSLIEAWEMIKFRWRDYCEDRNLDLDGSDPVITHQRIMGGYRIVFTTWRGTEEPNVSESFSLTFEIKLIWD